MFEVIKGAKLQKLISNQEICLRCGIDKRLVKKEGSNGCKSWGKYYKKHIYK
jgi:hypothetical protein